MRDGLTPALIQSPFAPADAPDVDVRHRTSWIFSNPAMAFAVAALLVDLAFLLVPLYGSNILFSSLSLREGFPFRVSVAVLLTLFAQAMTILIGLMLLRRGREAMASGVFVGLLVILGLRLVSSILTSINGSFWQTWFFLGVQTVECVLLLLAARAAARQQGTPRRLVA